MAEKEDRKPLSSANPLFYHVSVILRRMLRRLQWHFGGGKFALARDTGFFPHIVIAHRSILLRKLHGTDQVLQRNKVTSLRTAAEMVSGVIVEPGETFSFWRLVGRPLRRRGFLPGLQLSFGKMVSMVGGGLCQFSNLLHWMVLQTPMEVTERHRHSYDPFPDYRRTVPFGTGATIFYNYKDFMFTNRTSHRFQIRVWVDDEFLQGEIRSSDILPCSYSVQERGHRFVREGGQVYRENQLWRIRRDSSSGEVLEEKLIMENRSRVLYDVSEIPGITVEETAGDPEEGN